MKILVFTSLFPNHLEPDFGVFVKNRMVHVNLVPGCEVVIVAPVPFCPPWRMLGKWFRYSQIKRHEVISGVDVYHPRYLLIPKVSMLFHGLFMFLFSMGLVRMLHKKMGFDIIDAHYIYPDCLAGVLLGRWLKLPVCVSARGTDINDFPKFRTIRPMIKYTLSAAGQVISVCGALKDAMVKLGCPGKKINVIPNGIAVDRFYVTEQKVARRSLGLLENQKIIFSVGGLIPRKGHNLTINAMHEILAAEPNTQLVIAGKGEEEINLKNQVVDQGLKECVTFLGHVPNDQLIQWYNAADVFCLASSREGWANVIMESIACGLPVVATKVWGAPEIITTPDVGILVERNAESIADGLIQALGKTWDKKRIRAHVANRTWQVVAEEVKTVFDRLMSSKKV